MPPQYLDDNGNPIAAAPQVKQYLDDNGEPIKAASAAPQPQPGGPPVGFGASAIAPVVDAAKGAWQAATAPPQGAVEQGAQMLGPGALFLKRMLVDPAIAQGKEAYQDAQQGRYSEAAGHGLAAVIPGVGPAAANLAETEGKQLGSGDYAGAAGTLAGNTAVALGPKMIGKGASALKAGADAAAKGVTGVGTGATADLVKKAQAGNAVADAHIKTQAAIETARNNALKEGNSKYNTLNEKLNNIQANPDTIPSALGDAADKIRGSNTEPAIFKDMLKRVDNGDTFNYSDLQGYYSELGKELSKGTLPGDIYHAYDTLHEQLGDEMQRIADSQGQGAQLSDARQYWRRMKQTFGKPMGETDAATGVLRSESPEMAQHAETQNRIRMLGSFDPEIPKAFGELQKARAAAKDAPNVLPGGTAQIGPEDVQQAKADALQGRADTARKWGHRITGMAAGPLALYSLLHGNLEGLGADVAAGVAGYKLANLASRALENPTVVDFLTKPTAADIAQIPPEMRVNFPAIMQAAAQKGIKIDPRIPASMGLAALNGPKAKKLQEVVDAHRATLSQ